jgi:hypothetical protein
MPKFESLADKIGVSGALSIIPNKFFLQDFDVMISGFELMNEKVGQRVAISLFSDRNFISEAAIASCLSNIFDSIFCIILHKMDLIRQETDDHSLTPASAKIIGKNQIELTKNGKTLLLKVKAKGKIVMKTWSTDPPHDYDAPNPGTTLVGFEIILPANTKTAINVSLLPGETGTKRFKKIMPLEKWGK